MRLKAGVVSDRGLVRSVNEDSFFLRQGLYAVCDGMGGARAGEVASEMACMGLLALDPATAGEKELKTAVRNINHAIISRSLTDERLLGMGTTMTVALIRGKTLFLAHVGDSRAYLFRDGRLEQLTDDHSWVGELVRRGELTPAEAAIHPHRSVITRALGTDVELEPDLKELELREGDRLLLCTDGLTGLVAESQLAEILAREESPQTVAELLVKAALEAGGDDNVTAIVVDVLPEESKEPAETTERPEPAETTERPAEGSEGTEQPRESTDQPLGSAGRSLESSSPGRTQGEGAGDELADRIIIGPADRGGGMDWARRIRSSVVMEKLGLKPLAKPKLLLSEASESGKGEKEIPTGRDAKRHPARGQKLAEDLVLREGREPDEGQVPAATTTPHRSRRRWVPMAIGAAILLVVVVGFATFNSTVYYVGEYQGQVALYRGLPATVLGIDLSNAIELSRVSYEALDPYLRSRVDAHELVSKKEGQQFLRLLQIQGNLE